MQIIWQSFFNFKNRRFKAHIKDIVLFNENFRHYYGIPLFLKNHSLYESWFRLYILFTAWLCNIRCIWFNIRHPAIIFIARTGIVLILLRNYIVCSETSIHSLISLEEVVIVLALPYFQFVRFYEQNRDCPFYCVQPIQNTRNQIVINAFSIDCSAVTDLNWMVLECWFFHMIS